MRAAWISPGEINDADSDPSGHGLRKDLKVQFLTDKSN